MSHTIRILNASLAAVALLAACSSGPSGPGVASAGTTPSTSGSAHTAARGNPLAFSQCMRSHGVHDFPDPNSSGRIGIQAGPGSDLDPHNPTFQAAQNACKSLQPHESAADQQQHLQNALQFSQCMRQHGVRDFPDPTSTGQGVGIKINGGAGSDLNPNNPTFQAAQKACQHFIGSPGPGGGKNVTAGGGGS